MNKKLLIIFLVLCILSATVYIPDKSIATSYGDKNYYEDIRTSLG